MLHADELAYDISATTDTPQAQAQALGELVKQVAQAAGPLVAAARR